MRVCVLCISCCYIFPNKLFRFRETLVIFPDLTRITESIHRFLFYKNSSSWPSFLLNNENIKSIMTFSFISNSWRKNHEFFRFININVIPLLVPLPYELNVPTFMSLHWSVCLSPIKYYEPVFKNKKIFSAEKLIGEIVRSESWESWHVVGSFATSTSTTIQELGHSKSVKKLFKIPKLQNLRIFGNYCENSLIGKWTQWSVARWLQ